MKQNALQVQFAWFDNQAAQIHASDFFKRIFGIDPDTSQVNRAPSPHAPFLSMAQFTESDVSYTVHVGPGRVDLYAAASPQATPSALGPAALHTLDGFLVMDRILKSIVAAQEDGLTSTYRLAIVVQFTDEFKQLADANAEFSHRVRVDIVTNEAHDLLFQANVRKEIESNNYTINRLLRLQVESFQTVSYQIIPGLGTTVNPTERSMAETYSLTTSLDINVVPTSRMFTPAERSKIFETLCEEVKKMRLANTDKVVFVP